MDRLESDFPCRHYIYGRDSRKLSGNAVVCEVGGYGKELFNYEDVEVSTKTTA